MAEQGCGHRPQITAGVAKSRGHPLHQRRGRFVGHKMAHQLGRQEPGARRVAAQVVEQFVERVGAFGITFAENGFWPRLVQRRDKSGFSAGLRADRPASEQVCSLCHILLRVATIDAKCVQLQQLARQVFVQPLVAQPAGPRLRADRLRVVQIQQHGRVHDSGTQQRPETAKRMRPDGLNLMRPYQGDHGSLG